MDCFITLLRGSGLAHPNMMHDGGLLFKSKCCFQWFSNAFWTSRQMTVENLWWMEQWQYHCKEKQHSKLRWPKEQQERIPHPPIWPLWLWDICGAIWFAWSFITEMFMNSCYWRETERTVQWSRKNTQGCFSIPGVTQKINGEKISKPPPPNPAPSPQDKISAIWDKNEYSRQSTWYSQKAQ